MINVVDKYFNINRVLLLVIGMWPYEKSKFVGLQIICIYSILIIGIIFQLTTMLTSKCSVEIIIKVLSTVFPFIGCILTYNSFYVNSETVKYLMEQIQHIYNGLKDNNEIAIVEKYGNIAKHYTTGLTSFVCSMFIFFGVQLWHNFIDVILSTNVSRSRDLQISTEYFIDQERYFYLLLFHVNATIGIAIFVLLATGTTLLGYLYHACGMFRIASYRIEKAIQIYINYKFIKNINMQNEILVHKSIIHAVDIHRQAITFSSHLILKFEISFILLIVVGVLTLSLNVFQVLLSDNTVEELIMYFVLLTICLIYMFLCNFIGQEIIDHNNHVFITVYKVTWYVTPIFIQKLILFLMIRGNKKFGLNIGLFVASLELFSTLINAAVSYFTIMYSMR